MSDWVQACAYYYNDVRAYISIYFHLKLLYISVILYKWYFRQFNEVFAIIFYLTAHHLYILIHPRVYIVCYIGILYITTYLWQFFLYFQKFSIYDMCICVCLYVFCNSMQLNTLTLYHITYIIVWKHNTLFCLVLIMMVMAAVVCRWKAVKTQESLYKYW